MASDVLASRTDDFFISKEALADYDNECCSPFFLTQRQVVMLLSVMRYLEWETRWANGDIDGELVQTTIGELMTCRDDIVLQLTRIAEALYTSEEEPRSIADVIASTTANAQDNTPFLDVAADIATVLGVESEELPAIALEIIPLVLAGA